MMEEETGLLVLKVVSVSVQEREGATYMAVGAGLNCLCCWGKLPARHMCLGSGGVLCKWWGEARLPCCEGLQGCWAACIVGRS